ncbi:MAG: hypothetical protein ACI9JM_000436 [Halioglobus sp.]|jgi:hypothetical protein
MPSFDVFASLYRLGMNIRAPLFVIGNPRSGTSLLRLMLTSHSEVVIPPECGFIVWLHEKHADWTLRSAQDEQARSSFLNDLLDCKKFDTWGLSRSQVDAQILASQPKDYAALCAVVALAYANTQSKQVTLWGDKNNFHTQYLAMLSDLYPSSRFVHIVRDGRDIAVSYRAVMAAASSSPYAPNLSTDIREIACEWSANVIQVGDYLSQLPESRRLLVRYEDLVRHPKACVENMCEWLALEYESGMLSPHLQNSGRGLEPQATLDWKQRTLEPVADDTVGRFRKEISAAETIEFEEVAGTALTRFGYTATGLPYEGPS